MKIYLAGKMRGLEEDVWRANFHFAAHKLRAQGYEVFSPAEKECEIEFKGSNDEISFRRKVFHLDLSWICLHADIVALLPNWRESRGAIAERAAAEAVGLTVMELGSEYQPRA